mgnify:FL=1
MATVSSGSKAERFGFVADHGSILGVRYLCDWLKVSTTGYYKWRKRPESQRAIENRVLMAKVECLFKRHRGNYGSPRIHAELQRQGVMVNHKRVERLMRNAGLVGKAAVIYRRKPAPKKFYSKLKNLRVDLPVPDKINEQWVADLTYLKVDGEWRYLAVVMDLCSRRIIGWSLGKNKTAELTRQSLRFALRHREIKPGLIFHTDQGSEYGAYIIQDELKLSGMLPSMNRAKSVTDNAHMESFFQSMKTEAVHGIEFKTEHDLRMAIGYYINRYYNRVRLHSSIGYIPPVEYEAMAA